MAGKFALGSTAALGLSALCAGCASYLSTPQDVKSSVEGVAYYMPMRLIGVQVKVDEKDAQTPSILQVDASGDGLHPTNV